MIVGLYRNATAVDYAFAATALPTSWAIRSLRGNEPVGAPIQEPTETLSSIRHEATRVTVHARDSITAEIRLITR